MTTTEPKIYVTCKHCGGRIDITHLRGRAGRKPSKCTRPKCIQKRIEERGRA